MINVLSKMMILFIVFIVMLGSCNLENAFFPDNSQTAKLEFKDFDGVASVFNAILLNGLEARSDIKKLQEFQSMIDAYYKMQDLSNEEMPEYLARCKHFLKIEGKDDSTMYMLKINELFASVVNKNGEISVGGKNYNLLNTDSLNRFVKNLNPRFRDKQYKSRGILDPLLKGTLCHTYVNGVCVSVNKYIPHPSSAIMHVETWPGSTYRTKIRDIRANGKLTRLQMWKGNLLALNLTGAEISVWKPSKILVLRCTGLFKCKFVWKEFFGLLWFPYPTNQLYITWKLVDKTTGHIINYGTGSYEKQKKWWAGKWVKNKGQMSKLAKNSTLYYTVRDNSNRVVASGAW